MAKSQVTKLRDALERVNREYALLDKTFPVAKSLLHSYRLHLLKELEKGQKRK